MATSVTHSEAGNQEADRGNGLLLVSDKVADGCGRRTVSPIAISVIVLACVFGGALLGALLRGMLPEHHLSAESKDIVKLAMGLIATMSALVSGGC